MGSPSSPGPADALDLATRLRVVQDAYSDAGHDLDTVLLRPSLFDGRDPVTAEFLGALRTGEQLPRRGRSLEVSWAADSALYTLETAWRRAREEAGRVGLSRLGLRERLRIRRARRLLHQAGSDRGSVPLRLRQFHRAEQLLSGLVTLPAPLRAEILAAVRTPSRIEGPIGEGGPDSGGPM